MSKTTTAIIIALVLLLVAQNAWQWSRRVRRRWIARRRSRRAVRGEIEAESLVEKHGFEIVDSQANTTWTIHVDGEPVEMNLRADLILSRDGKSFVADVKTGKTAPRITTASTRRQLLEYLYAYAVDGVLLVDMASKEIKEVEFGPVERKVSRPVGQLVAAFAMGVVVALVNSIW